MTTHPARSLALALLVLTSAACAPGAEAERTSGATADSAVSLVDDLGHTVRLPGPARRVVALLPSASETLVAIGAGGQLVGRTDHDREPAVAALPSVGSGRDPSLERVAALRPDLVVHWASARPAVRDRIAALGVPVYSARATDTAGVFRTIANLGRLAGRTRAADSLATSIRREIADVRASVAGLPRPSVLYVVWGDPPLTAGPRTYVGELIEAAGGRSAFPDVEDDWPTVSLEAVVQRQPEVVIVPVGGTSGHAMPLLQGEPGWRELRALRQGGATVPADLMNRPGPRLGEAARLLRDAIHPIRAPE